MKALEDQIAEGAAQVLGCSRRRVDELIADGTLPTVDGPGRGRALTRKHLAEYVDRLIRDEQRQTRKQLRGVA